ncbi:hypothetical protein BJX70DRAFT_380906 [Aspergillus crustosus]
MNLVQKPPPELLLQYDPAYSVLICKSCSYAIQPGGIARHLKTNHHIYRSHRKPYMDYASRFELADPKDIIQAEVKEFPIGLLPTFNGLQCLSADECKHLCVSRKRMQKHWLAVHGRHGNAQHDWSPAPLQTFFRGNLLHYFTRPQITETIHQGTFQDTHYADIPTQLDELDRKLFHHYLSSTSLTLVDVHGTQDIWQHIIPQMAQEHAFLMHAILACSALHLAHQFPPDAIYLTRGHAHQDTAMPLFRHAIAHVDQRNCHPILAFSHLLAIYSFAAGRADESLLFIDTSSRNPELMCSWLYFIRNGCFLVCGFWDEIRMGPVGSLATSWELPVAGVGGLTKLRVTDHLLSLVQMDETNQIAIEVFREAAEQLGSAIEAAQALNGRYFTTWDIVRVWPMQISATYIELLTHKRPGALILLAHYCLLLKMAEPRWYLKNLAEGLFRSVLGQLDPEWRRCVLQSFQEMEGFLSLPGRMNEGLSANA